MQRNNKKIGVVNRTNLKNYGSVLQCYALCRAIFNLGYESEILWETGTTSANFDFRPKKIMKTFASLIKHPSLISGTIENVKGIRKKEIPDETVQLFDSFVEDNIHQKLMEHEKLIQLANTDEYKKFVCGSDQVWCSTTTYVDPLMYLQFAPEEKRVAYAPSIGRNYIPSYNEKQMRLYINEIPYVSIREDEGQRLVKELTGREVPVVADPTLLIKKDEWKELESAVEIKKPYILCYFLDEPLDKVQNEIKKLSERCGCKIVSIGCELESLNNDSIYSRPNSGPAQFLTYVSEADFVITDSYHGMLFSIIYNKRFYSVERQYGKFDQSSRQLTVLKRIELLDRYIRSNEEIRFSEKEIEYDKVKPRLSMFVDESYRYLESALSGE